MSASAILKLQAAGFSTEQVTALAELIDTQAASKSDLLEVEHRLDTRFGELEHRLEAKISDGNIATIKWVVGMGFAQVGLMLAVIKLFQH